MPLNFTSMFALPSLVFYRSDWDSLLLYNITGVQGTAITKVQNTFLPSITKEKKRANSWISGHPSLWWLKIPRSFHLPNICLIPHLLKEILMNPDQALPFSLKPFSSSQLQQPCTFGLNHSVRVNSDPRWIKKNFPPGKLSLRLLYSSHSSKDTEFLRTSKYGNWANMPYVGICSPYREKQRKVTYTVSEKWNRPAERHGESQGRGGRSPSVLNPPPALNLVKFH